MNIVCDKTLLSAAIDGVSKAVTMRSAIPVLEGILLKAEGFQLTLTGYDLEMGIVTTIEANVKEPGEIVLNAKLLSSMISRMPAGQISILSADNGKTTIKSGVAEFEIQSMAATDFPDLPNTGAEETLTIPTGVLRDMIDRTLYAVSQDEKKPAHTGELFEIEPDKLTIVALDGYRLAIVERPVTAVKDIRIIVPSKTMTEVAHLLPNDDEEPVHILHPRLAQVLLALLVGRDHRLHLSPDQGSRCRLKGKHRWFIFFFPIPHHFPQQLLMSSVKTVKLTDRDRSRLFYLKFSGSGKILHLTLLPERSYVVSIVSSPADRHRDR